MSNDDLLLNYSFTVKIDGVTASFSKVNNISGSAEIDTIVVGGNNMSPHIMMKPKKNPDMLILEKGCKTSMNDMLFSMFSEGKKVTNLTILCKRGDKVCRIFTVNSGIVVRREYSPLDAMGNEVFVEMLQIAHTGITELVLPVAINGGFLG